VEEMIYKFEVNMQDTTLHNLKAPWLKLHKLSNDTKELSEIVNDYYDAVGAVENFEDIGSNEVSEKSIEKKLHFMFMKKIRIFTACYEI
jgi:hypothetical protein